MLKFEGILVGTKIKAFDFEPFHNRPNMYVVGKITGTTVRDGAKFYIIDCTEDTGLPRRPRVGQEVYVPMETTMDFDRRVTPLDGPCAMSI